MATNVNVIIADNKVYATYVKTICFEAPLTGDNYDASVIMMAKASAFDYACNFGFVNIEIFNFKGAIMSSEDVFTFLDNQK